MTARDDMAAAMLGHFNPMRGQWRLNPSAAANDIVSMLTSDAAVERVAIQIFVHDAPSNDPADWPATDKYLQLDYLSAARAAISALLGGEQG